MDMRMWSLKSTRNVGTIGTDTGAQNDADDCINISYHHGQSFVMATNCIWANVVSYVVQTTSFTRNVIILQKYSVSLS